MKLSYFILFCIFSILLSCKERPTYNPFDNQFNIDESYFVKDELDTIWDTCGYYSLSKKVNDFEVFYGYLDSDLLGKGFSISIDTIQLPKKYSFEIRDSINSLPFNPQKLNLALKKFNYKYQKQIDKKVFLINNKDNKIDTAEIISENTDYVNFHRKISFINRNKKYKDW